MAKQWWQDKNKPIKPWIIRLRRDPCNDSQWADLRQTGYSEKQGPTHYCPICRWAFWPITFVPNSDQVKYAQMSDPNANLTNMTYTRLCNKPKPKYGQTVEYTMMQQLATLCPDFLSESLKEYWLEKYCTKYPSTEVAKRRADYLKRLANLYKV